MHCIRLVDVMPIFLLSIHLKYGSGCQYNAATQVNYLGCFLDDSARIFPYVYRDRSYANMTNNFCVLGCRDVGFKYAGTEGSIWCHCGNDPYVNKLLYPKVPETNCNTPCNGNLSTMCGGQWRISVYATGIKSSSTYIQHVSVVSGMDLNASPLHQTSVSISVSAENIGLQDAMECASNCRNNNECKVFSLSTYAYSCKLFRLVDLCNGFKVYPNTTLFKII